MLNYGQNINQNDCCREKKDVEEQIINSFLHMNFQLKMNIFVRKGI